MNKNNLDVSDENEIEDLLDGLYVEDEPLRDAKKFLSLMEEFDIKEGSNMEANLQKSKKRIHETVIEVQNEDQLVELSTSIVDSNELLEDFILVRKTLREDVKATRVLLSKLSEDLTNMCAEDMNGQVVMAFSDMKKSNVKSMELLINSYEKVAQTQLSVKKLTQELKTEENKQKQLEASEDGGTSIQNAIFVGSPSELLASLKG